MSKSTARIDLRLKEIAQSPALRKWFAHDPAKWLEFRRRYFRELDANSEAVATLHAHARRDTVTLVYGAEDREYNDAIALEEYLAGARE